MSEASKKKAEHLTREILKLSFPLCKHSDPDISIDLAKINNHAHDLLKLLDRKELE
jgi:hypothetical protein